MNIFVLDEDPVKSAQMQCDKHVVKMVLETAQLLCSVYDKAPYRRTHYNHPCAIWTRTSLANYKWLIEHGRALAEEYKLRYGKEHASKIVIEWCAVELRDNPPTFIQNSNVLTNFAQAMPENLRHKNAVVAYRTYYKKAKSEIAKWSHVRQQPNWW